MKISRKFRLPDVAGVPGSRSVVRDAGRCPLSVIGSVLMSDVDHVAAAEIATHQIDGPRATRRQWEQT